MTRIEGVLNYILGPVWAAASDNIGTENSDNLDKLGHTVAESKVALVTKKKRKYAKLLKLRQKEAYEDLIMSE